MRRFFKIFLTFAKIGVFTFGGGYSMLPIMQRDLVERKAWLSTEELKDYFSVSHCLPGIITVNNAVFIGHKQGGRIGGIAAALGVIFPSIAVILIVAAFLTRYSNIPAVRYAFSGIRVCVLVLIVNAIVKMWKDAMVDLGSLAVFFMVFAVSVFTNFSVAILIVTAAAAGIGIKAVRRLHK